MSGIQLQRYVLNGANAKPKKSKLCEIATGRLFENSPGTNYISSINIIYIHKYILIIIYYVNTYSQTLWSGIQNNNAFLGSASEK